MLRRLVLASAVGAAALAAASAQAQTSPQPSTAPRPAPSQTAPSQPAGTPNAQAPSPSGQAAQPGIRTVDPTTLVLTFYTVQPADMLVGNLLGTNVVNLQNETVGEIENLVIDDGKRIKAVVLGVGGFLGLGERYASVDPGSLLISRDASGTMRAVINTTRETLRNAPEFKFEGGMQRRQR